MSQGNAAKCAGTLAQYAAKVNLAEWPNVPPVVAADFFWTTCQAICSWVKKGDLAGFQLPDGRWRIDREDCYRIALCRERELVPARLRKLKTSMSNRKTADTRMKAILGYHLMQREQLGIDTIDPIQETA